MNNLNTWEGILNNLFNNSIPNYCQWQDIDAIVNILNKLGSVPNSNHMFYPSGGGLDVKGALMSNEKNLIEIKTPYADVLSPKKLTFHKLNDIEQSYFRIELNEISSLGIGDSLGYSEQLCELKPAEYVSSRVMEDGEYNGLPLPTSARYVQRLLKGSLVIFSKQSIYNKAGKTYDGRHDKYDEDGFNAYLKKQLKEV